jgi:hypothetical protein
MSSSAPWLMELVAVADASAEMADIPAFEVGLIISGRRSGFAAPPARISDGLQAVAWVEGSEATFQQIVGGAITPQQAFLAGLLSCQGEPEVLLRFTALLEACGSSRRQ